MYIRRERRHRQQEKNYFTNVIAPKLGRRTIRDRIAATGRSLSEPQLDELTTTMRSFFKQSRTSLSLPEFDLLVASLADSHG